MRVDIWSAQKAVRLALEGTLCGEIDETESKMLVGSIAKLLANVSAPIAALFALGYVAQVVNIWRVARRNYDYNFITAWHIASVIDRTVVIGIGLKYLV